MLLLFSLWALALAATSSSIDSQMEQRGLPTREGPVLNFKVISPIGGAIEALPLEFHVEIGIKTIAAYRSYIVDKLLCVEVNEARRKCSSMTNPSIIFYDLPDGNYSAVAFISDIIGSIRYHETSETRFSIVSRKALASYTANLSRESKESSLLEWASQRQNELENIVNKAAGIGRLGDEDAALKDTTSTMNASDVFLVIGVKTAVVKNFDLRQAIRETWASADSLPRDIKVFFIGCEADLSGIDDADERKQVRNAISLEKQTYSDLLTDDLHCDDSYADLPNKVTEFLRFATLEFATTPFIMIADDDIYLRVDKLADELRAVRHRQRLYIGQVWDKLIGRSQTPVRDPTERYYVSEKYYPLHTYPPFAFGPHYLLSMDCARFIVKNSERLRGLGAIDDVSVALWLMTIQVHVEHTPAFANLRLGACKNDLTSFADLSPYGIRSIHNNLFQKRGMCYNFNRALWQMKTTT
ncbi:Galactosyltransferase [Phytophthora infestans]|uniref:Hexosyltransferase n=1 Tax=Phytophthora infestans TaxID=4787 RepID=A0A8S9UJQ6_PHYIN|nr:Galactosyltransferase [Phytophthora infestans]KAF4142061.1 Galactosyltransferase [Phytophthora infestans]